MTGSPPAPLARRAAAPNGHAPAPAARAPRRVRRSRPHSAPAALPCRPVSADAEAPSAARWLAPLAVGALVVAMQCGSALQHPLTRQVGSIYSEAPGHLWGLWTTAAGLFEHGPFVRAAEVGWPDGYTRHLMDVSNLLLFLPGYWLLGGGAAGASLGWNLVHGGSIALGAAGLVALGRRLFGGNPDAPYAIAVAIAVFCASPFLLQHPSMGRTEYLPAVWLPLFLALFHRWMRRPAGLTSAVEARPPAWVGVAAGLTLAAVVLGGWYLAVFAAVLAPPVAIAWSAGLRPREVAARLVSVVAVAAVPVIPAIRALLDAPPGGRGIGDEEPIPSHVLANQLRLGDVDPGMHMGQPAYVGLAALVLAVAGAIGAPRRALGWLLLAGWAFVAAAGPHGLGGRDPASMADPVVMPVAWLVAWVPPLTAVHDWSRMAVVAALPLALGAAWGVLALARWSRSPGPVVLAACALVLVDQASFPKRWTSDQPWFASQAPPRLIEGLATLPPGPIVALPVDIQHRLGGPEVRGLGFLWQLQHGRPIPGLPEGKTDTTLVHSHLARLAVLRQELSVMIRGGSVDSSVRPDVAPPPPSDEDVRCARLDAADLRARGYVGVAVTTSLGGGADLDEYLTALLGPPAFAEEPAWIWDLARVPDGAGAPCTLPQLPPRVARDLDPRDGSARPGTPPGTGTRRPTGPVPTPG